MAGSLLRFHEGDVIIKEGEVIFEMYKILSGKAEVYVSYGTPQELVLGIIGEQGCFNEFGVLIGKPSICTVVAYCDMAVLRITDDQMEDFIKTNHNNIMDIMRNMANTMTTMKCHIDMLTRELEEGKKPSPETISKTKLAMREYMMHQLQKGKNANLNRRT